MGAKQEVQQEIIQEHFKLLFFACFTFSRKKRANLMVKPNDPQEGVALKSVSQSSSLAHVDA